MPAESTPFERRHQDQKVGRDIDQAEFSALDTGSAVFESGIYDDRIADSLDDVDPELAQGEPWQRNDLQLDVAAGRVLEQVEVRRKVLGDHYPFSVEKNSLVHRKSNSLVYEFCLAIANAPSITKGPFVELPRAFEDLAQQLTEAFLGEGAKSFHTGWPRHDGNSPRFKAHMAKLSDATQEWIWQPEKEYPDDPDPKYVKDEGIDFVVWKPHLDGRVGSLFLLGQCACGDDWLDKFDDINVDKLGKWFHPMTLVGPVKVFCTPFHVSDGLVRDASREAGLILDRVRLSLIAEQVRQPQLNWDMSKMIDMVRRSEKPV